MLQTTVVLSIVFSFLSYELLGILSGGIVSAGYLAFYFNQPSRVLTTLFLAVITCLVVKLLQYRIILFGRRRFMITVLLSIFFAQLIEQCFVFLVTIPQDMRIIGYIIPGLIANDMEKQGIFKTIMMVVVIAGIIWLLTQTKII